MKNLEIIKRLSLNYIKKYTYLYVVCFIFIIVSSGLTSVSAWLLDPAIKEIFINKNKKMLFIIPMAIVVVFLLKSLSTVIVRIVSIKIGLKILQDIQMSMTKKILNSDISFIFNIHSSKIISNFMNDTQILFNVLTGTIINSAKETLTLIFLIGLMFYYDWQLTLLALIAIPFSALVSKKFGKKIGKVTNNAMIATENLTKSLSEVLKGSLLIKIYQKEKIEEKKISLSIENRYKKLRKTEQIRHGSAPIMELITSISIAGIIFFAGYRSIQGFISSTEFISFLAALMMAYQPVKTLGNINMGIYEGIAASKRIFDFIDQRNKILENINAIDLKINKAEIFFQNVSFSYPENKNVLENLTLKINGGSKVALVGYSGEGKTTILNLIPRFYDVKSGEIFIDNQNIKNVTLNSLRKEISIVTQDIILFDDTIKNNVAYSNENITDDKIIAALKFAAIYDFVEKLPNGINTLIGENGIKLSGGQKQRISIARAILKDSSIIILDEATSSLDSKSERKVQDAIENLTNNKTTIIIAHRISTIVNCDKIFVLDKGKIAEEGSHDELMRKSNIYKNLYDMQILK